MNKRDNKSIKPDSPERDISPNETNEAPIYLTESGTLQTPEEDQRDKSIDPAKDNIMEVSNDDLHETNADRVTGMTRPHIN